MCLKWHLPAAAVLIGLDRSGTGAAFLAAASGAALAVLPWDLRESGMLGDGGANLLGFVVGTAFAARSGPAAMIAALVAIVLLHVLAETVTLSRLIRLIRPLTWYDGLGRAAARAQDRADPVAEAPREGQGPR